MADLEVQPRSRRSSRTVQGLGGDVALLSFDNVAAWPENAQRIAEILGLRGSSQLIPESRVLNCIWTYLSWWRKMHIGKIFPWRRALACVAREELSDAAIYFDTTFARSHRDCCETLPATNAVATALVLMPVIDRTRLYTEPLHVESCSLYLLRHFTCQPPGYTG
ncbi:hypothetical protein K466DRAFT_167972 [Polyporus arcularius HHB13444]|uniref:Uncharacterized protein n=1 Tax=Polyporus arcularius HHB13444 TaxID=1314778 RepID=A0A5C3P8M4_9APHY|nr:hypothetical protein K466DRAFT_167972 [Polyporus arcularius HHB13444]